MCVCMYSYLYPFLSSEALQSQWYHPSPSQLLAPCPEAGELGLRHSCYFSLYYPPARAVFEIIQGSLISGHPSRWGFFFSQYKFDARAL